MARILFCAHSNDNQTSKQSYDCYAETFLNALVEVGHNVLAIRTNSFVSNSLSSDLSIGFARDFFNKEIKNFSPELIITFNNSLPGGDILHITGCPIIVLPTDIPTFWSGLDLIRDYLDRYYFFDVTEYGTQRIFEMFPGLSRERIIPLGYFTAVYNIPQEQDIDVSFVGSIENNSFSIENYFKALGRNRSLSHEEKNRCKDEFFQTLESLQQHKLEGFVFDYPHHDLKGDTTFEVIQMQAAYLRMQVLSQLTDFNLQIFGLPSSWSRVLQYDYEIFRCFNYRSCVTLKDLIDMYNRSKISMNLPHGNIIDSFSWGICDILASNAVLCSVRNGDLMALMKGYADLPMYESPSEARELCQKLLADNIWRDELVVASNQMIEDKCRLVPKLRSIASAISSIDMYPNCTGQLTSIASPNPVNASFRDKVISIFRS